MSVGNKIRALLCLADKNSADLAAQFGIPVQAMRNKLSRGTFSAEELIKIADFMGCECELAFIYETQKINLSMKDIREEKSSGKEKEQ